MAQLADGYDRVTEPPRSLASGSSERLRHPR